MEGKGSGMTQTGVAATIEDHAKEALAWFEVARRATGDTDTGPREDGERYVRVKDGAPQWVTDVCFVGHDSGQMFPDDWRYECIQDALEAISDGADDNDGAHEFADGGVDVYSHNLREWVSSHGLRSGYVDEAQEQGLLSADASFDERIMAGQYLERREVFESVYRTLEELADEQDEDGA